MVRVDIETIVMAAGPVPSLIVLRYFFITPDNRIKFSAAGSLIQIKPIQTDYDFEKGEHRTMTFVFAKERSLQGIREALDNRRTAAYFHELLIGREDLLRPFFEKCVKIEEVLLFCKVFYHSNLALTLQQPCINLAISNTASESN